MRVPINLASQPLENLRPVRAALAAAALLALVLGALILNRELRNRNEFRSLIEQQSALELRLRDLQSQQAELESALSTKEAQQIRERSGIMNSLILRKSISWTQLFMDLEKILPARTRITAIHPELNASEDVDLDLTIAAASMEPLVEFLKKLETSEVFGAPDVGAQHQLNESNSEGGIALDLTTRYVQNRSKNLPANRAAASGSPSPQPEPAPDLEKSETAISEPGMSAAKRPESELPDIDKPGAGKKVEEKP